MPSKCPHALLTLAYLVLMAGSGRLAVKAQQQVGSLMGTKTIYSQRLTIPGAPSIHGSPDPQGYEAHTLWLLSRHGSRWPTADRMRQINSLEPLFKDVGNKADYPWMKGWRSPVGHLLYASGELHAKGEEELWSLARRLRRRFPAIAHAPYVPKRFPIVSTQVARAAASASAFATGFFPSVRSSGLASFDPQHSATTRRTSRRRLRAAVQHPGGQADLSMAQGQEVERRPQAVAITMMPKLQDPLLRFFDLCPKYAQREADLKGWLGAWTADGYATLAPALSVRLNMTNLLGPCEVEALWTLCQFEAGIEGISDRACGLFTLDELRYLEWLSDVGLLEAQAWGSTLNYHIASPLVQDMHDTLLEAATSSSPGAVRPHARLLFAHCETLVPLATLMGLFKPELPPTPPSAQALRTHTPADVAQSMLLTADSAEDLGLHQVLTAAPSALQPAQQAGTDSNTAGSSGGESIRKPHGMREGVTVCSHGLEPEHRVPPAGWFPRTPFNESRVFRGGRVSPFGANMAVVLYMPLHRAQARPKVRLVYNEQIIPIPGCTADPHGLKDEQGQGLDCDLDQFLELLKTKASKAKTLEQMCAPEA